MLRRQKSAGLSEHWEKAGDCRKTEAGLGCPGGSVSHELGVTSKLSLHPARSPSGVRLSLGRVSLAGMWFQGPIGLESSPVGMGSGSGTEPPLSWVCRAAGGPQPCQPRRALVGNVAASSQAYSPASELPPLCFSPQGLLVSSRLPVPGQEGCPAGCRSWGWGRQCVSQKLAT